MDLSAYITPNVWNITGSNAGSVNGAMPFTSIENLTGGVAADELVFGDGAVLSGIADGQGGSDTADLSAYTSPNTWQITANNTGIIDGVAGFMSVENLVGGADADDLVFANGAGVVGLVDGRSGYDTLDWSAYDVIHPVSVNRETLSATGTGGYGGIEQVIGGAGLDTLMGANALATWHVTADDAGDVGGAGVFDFWSVENLTGGTAADLFVFSDGMLAAGGVDGQGGMDTIDLSAYTTTNTWDVTGDNAGTINGAMPFASIENLIGGTAVDAFIFADGAVVGDGLNGEAGEDILDMSAYTTPNVWTVDGPNGYVETQRGNFSFLSIENQIASQSTFREEFVDLVSSVDQTWLPGTLVPGDRGWVAVKVTNEGNESLLDQIGIDVYLSTDTILSKGSDTLVGSIEDRWINLMPGWSSTHWVTVSLPPELSAGTYYVLADVDTEDVVVETNEVNNVASTAQAWSTVWKFGEVEGRIGVRLTVNDSAGTTVTFALYGPGVGKVVGGPEFTEVVLTGTTVGSYMLVSTAGLGSGTALNDMTVRSDVGAIIGLSTDLNGTVEIDGDLNVLQVLGGDVNGDVMLTGSRIGTVMAQPKYVDGGWVGGSIRGDIIADGDIGGVYALRGGVSGSVQSAAGRIGTVLAIGGDVDLTGGKTISAGTGINAILAINGNILGDGAGSPDIYVDDGSLWSLQAVGGGMQNVWVDVNGASPLAGRLGSVSVGGSVSNSLFEAQGLLSSLLAQGDFTNSSVRAGSLSVVHVGGTISEDATDGDTDEIRAYEGTFFARDDTWAGLVDGGTERWFGDVRAWVG